MDDQKYKPGQPFEGDANEPKRQESSESGSSYYYSYGPFQSYGKTNEEPGHPPDNEHHQAEDVEVTRPQPLRPYPSSYDMVRSAVEPASGSDGDGRGSLPAAKSTNWQYNSKPPRKTSVRSVIAGVLAGMLIMAGAMVFADRTNLFTPDQAANASVPASGNASSASGGADSAGKATTALYPVTDSGEVTKVVNQAGPAVVKIETLTDASKQRGSNSYGSDPFYRYFFGDDAFGFGGNSGNGDNGDGSNNGGSSSGSSQLVPTGIGSGFIFDKTGYILTNEHVVHNADVVRVTVQGTEKPYEAKVLGTSYELDLAVLKIDGSNFPSIPLGNSGNTQVGEWLVAIGNPKGFDHTVTVGVLSAKERGPITIPGENGEKDREYEHLLQTDASINPGNSGGPLLNLNGEVVGINVAVSSDSQGIGFAIPTSTISEVLDKLKNNEKIPQKPVPFIGATLMTMTDEVAKQMQTDVKEGSIVTDIVFKSPAYNADLRPYDIITGANGTKFATKEKLIEYIQKQQVGTKVKLNVVRDGKKIDLEVMIGDKNEFPNVN
ncbi:S1C family serine protease [Paenibacillus phocaensis]|uniref:S1C family serine protease n=1 Tax=Paenibacillus phocaensis TaxID=1776378 RepID=UPI000839CB22|nr:trypsin-like peptidase domain-containing protein [Paenibacillus phocaensis]